MITKTVTIGDQEYEIAELPLRKNSAWRKSLQIEFSNIADVLSGAPDVDISNMEDLGDLIQSLSHNLIGSIDQITELLFSYAPVLEADRERIEEAAYESEILDSFTAVLSLAFPFGILAGKLATMGRDLTAIGSTENPT